MFRINYVYKLKFSGEILFWNFYITFSKSKCSMSKFFINLAVKKYMFYLKSIFIENTLKSNDPENLENSALLFQLLSR